MDKIMMKYLMTLALKAFCMKIDEKLFDLSEIKENFINNNIKNEIKKEDEMSIISKDNLNNQNDKNMKIDIIENERDENNIFMLENLLEANNCKKKLKEILLKDGLNIYFKIKAFLIEV